jgi:CubicO group peptidase (beta-lactamase class C family)
VSATARLASLAISVAVLSAAVAARQNPGPSVETGTTAFESYIELLRQQAAIPAISGALIQDGVVVWERGLGFANLETRIAARPDTPYAIGDLTQPFAAVLLLQCVEQRRLDLDHPLRSYGALPNSDATMRQVLSHTSTPTPGTFKYDAGRYAELTAVMEYCAPQPFRKSLAHRMLDPLAMVDSVPGRDMQIPDVAPQDLFAPADLTRYADVLERLAVPYKVDKRGRATRTELPPEGINAATGLVSTVRDLARFDTALDAGILLLEDTLAASWSAVPGPDGPQPMGLGWFQQPYKGTPVVWHFGVVPTGYSALMVKVPSRRATMILLANSDGLAPAGLLEAGDVTRSVFASVFLRMLL